MPANSELRLRAGEPIKPKLEYLGFTVGEAWTLGCMPSGF